jgi:hypothetical protein
MVRLASKKSPRPRPHRRGLDSRTHDAARSLWTDEAILSRLDDLLLLPPRVRMQNVLIHGVSGAGKSMIIEKFIRDHPLEFGFGRPQRSIVSMQMPPMPTMRSFFAELLRCLDCPVITGSRISELENDVLRQLTKMQPRLLAIDEVHHLLACTPREQRAALNVLKYLSNKLRVSIIALGTNEALHVMRTDSQIASRFESCALPAWAATEDLRRFIAGFLMQLGVEAADIVNNAVAIDYILDLTSGVTGRIVELLRQSARLALGREAATVSVEDLQHAGRAFAADIGSERNVTH